MNYEEVNIISVKSVDRILDIFELLTQYPSGLTSKEIGDKLGYAPSSTFQLLKNLSERNYLLINDKKNYSLGPKLIHLGACTSEYLNINQIAKPILNQIVEKVNETIFLAVVSNNEIVYIDKVDSFRSMWTNVRIGSRKPLHCTALGKSFLSFADYDKSNKIINQINLIPHTKNTITDKNILIQELKKFRQLGYTIDDEEIVEGMLCISTPIYDYNNDVVSAISVSGPKERMLQNKENIIQNLLSASKEISMKIGCNNF